MRLEPLSTFRDPPLPARQLDALRARLLAHYDEARRDLPWRGESDPYRIWVSEVMLQQTRVETVIPYYRRWLELFPDVAALADAELDDVLLAWQGLGYYRRARGLHAGAALVRDRHGGRMPGDRAGLRELPGVGEYTAGAVASIAYGEPVAAVDGNVKRVFARWFDVARPGAAWLRDMAGALVDPHRPGDWNQALMDLGAVVCTPRSPECERCPMAAWCGARAAGTQADRPATAKRGPVPTRVLATAVVVDARGLALVARRAHGGLLGGMWAFPDVDIEEEREIDGKPESAADRESTVVAAAASAAASAGARLGGAAPIPLPPVRHRFTHLAASYRPVLLTGDGGDAEDRRWIPLDEPWPVALPVAQQHIARAASVALAPFRTSE